MSWWHDQAGRYPLLTPAQEIHLGTMVRQWLDHPDPVPPAIARRGLRARDRFVQSNLRLVCSLAERYRSVPAQYSDDLLQAGNLGLIRAVEKFDPTRGYKFSTYAYWWIRQGIHSFLEHHSRSIRLPTNHANQFSRLQSTVLALVSELGRPPSRVEIAAAAGWSMETLERVLARPTTACSLDQPNRQRDDGGPIVESIAAPADDPYDAIDLVEQLDQMLLAMARLTPLEQRLLQDYYLSPEPLTLTQLGRREGFGRERVRDMLRTSLNRLRLMLNSSASLPPPEQASDQTSYGPQLALF